MARTNWIIVTVDRNPKKWPTAKDLMELKGLSLRVAYRWAMVRRQMSPKGLRRWAHEHRN